MLLSILLRTSGRMHLGRQSFTAHCRVVDPWCISLLTCGWCSIQLAASRAAACTIWSLGTAQHNYRHESETQMVLHQRHQQSHSQCRRVVAAHTTGSKASNDRQKRHAVGLHAAGASYDAYLRRMLAWPDRNPSFSTTCSCITYTNEQLGTSEGGSKYTRMPSRHVHGLHIVCCPIHNNLV
jgi:hypothetical protein